jgi:general secretion pathway protein G
MSFNKRTGFTMIELVFVIVVIGILSAIAIPRLAATRGDAQIAKGRSDVAAIRSAIVNERQTRLLQGDSAYINKLDALTGNSNNGDMLFDNNGTAARSLLQYGIASSNAAGHWRKTANNTYAYKNPSNIDVSFSYTQATGSFDCTHTDGNCTALTQ